MSNENQAPERVYLQVEDDDFEGASWCADRINEEDVEYIRADLLSNLLDALKRQYSEGEQIKHSVAVQFAIKKARAGLGGTHGR